MPRPRPFLAIWAVLALMPVTVCRPQPPAAELEPAPVPVPVAATTRHTTPPPVDCPRPHGTRVTATGTALRTATREYPAADHPHDVAFSAETLRSLPDVAGVGDPIDVPYVLSRGAFAAAGAVAQVTFENATSHLISVTDIRPVNIVTECVPHAALIPLHGTGAEPAPMMFDLADVDPLMWSTDEGGRATRPYFEEYPGMLIEDGERQDLLFSFRADSGAYTFDLLVTYETGGRRERTLLRNGRVGFRVTTAPDPPQA
ncbi:hypothetical protein KZ829_18505 [Actinoplanes hulinensis]|uniref:Uncharacterized protein n=1 Tax=Actinoplanes hulinensis TaxID=1144547 RepID=A0ABS7B3X3_9ACTN|nr:hypothetical protein [Actinoplanes hulinensis]MBW6435737.1 hypothetical protein [Actinoplanes hulinensis]